MYVSRAVEIKMLNIQLSLPKRPKTSIVIYRLSLSLRIIIKENFLSYSVRENFSSQIMIMILNSQIPKWLLRSKLHKPIE